MSAEPNNDHQSESAVSLKSGSLKSGGDLGAGSAVDVHELMTRIRSMVAEKLATPRPVFTPLSPSQNGSAPLAGELLHSSELRMINQRHAFSLDVNPGRIPGSHRGGILGRLVTGIKRKFLVLIRDSILADYLRAEHEFQSAVTKYLNLMTRYIDERDSADFWKLVHKIDVDTGKSVERIDRIADELEGSLATLRAEVLAESHMRTESLAASCEIDAPISGEAIRVSPAMSPQLVSIVHEINAHIKRLDQRLDQLVHQVDRSNKSNG